MKQAVKDALRETIEPMIAQIGEQIKQLVEGANARLAASEQKMAQFDQRIGALEAGGTPGDLTQRVEDLESRAVAHEVDLQNLSRRGDRHQIRIRWIERLIHLFHGWRPNPNL